VAKITSKVLALVAKALGKKYDVQISVGAYQTASTNGTSIYVPVVDGEHAVSLARGYIDHEAAHIRLTDFSIMPTDDFRGQLLNILEDIRIEKAIGKDYPGCAVNLRQLSAVLEEKYGVFQPTPGKPSSSVLAWISAQGRADTLAHDSMVNSAKAAEPDARMIFGKHFPEAQRLLATIPSLPEDKSGTAAVRDLRDKFMVLLAQAKEDLENPPPPPAPAPQPEPQPEQEPEQEAEKQPGEQDEAADDTKNENEDDSPEEGDENTEEGSSTEPDTDENDTEGGDSNPDEEDSDAGDSHQSKDKGEPQGGSDSEEGEGDTDGSGSGKGESEADEEGETEGEGKSNGGSGGEGENDATAEGGKPEASKDGNGAGAGTGPGTPEEVSAAMEALEEALGNGTVNFGDVSVLLRELLQEAAIESAGSLDGVPRVPQIIKHPTADTASPFQDLLMVKSHTAKLRAQVSGLIQASKLQRSLPTRSGRKLDNRVLSRLSVGDDRLFSRRDEKKGVNTAVLHILDGSGSMFDQSPGAKMFVATRACFVALEALYPVPGVTSAAIEFNSMTNAVYGLCGWGVKPDSKNLHHNSAGGTELSTALWAGWSELIGRSEPRKIAIVYSDGDTAYNDQIPTHAAIKRMKEDGIEVIGIGIQDCGLLKYLQKETQIINDLSQLTPALLRLLKDKLLEAA